MQKYLALYPWGAIETWVDLRKNFYDIEYTGEYPKYGNGWDKTTITQKRDEDPAKVYKGFWLQPAQVQGRKSAFTAVRPASVCARATIPNICGTRRTWMPLNPSVAKNWIISAPSCGSAIPVTCLLRDDLLMI